MSGGASLGMSRSHQGSGGSSSSNSFGYSGGSSSTTQDVFNSEIFSRLQGGASDAAGRAALMAPELRQAAQQLFTGGSSFLDSLGKDAGSDYLAGRVAGDDSLLQQQIGGLKEDLGDLFTNQLNPAITANAVAGGTLGGGRQGVAQGIAMGDIAKQFARGSTALRTADQGQRDAAAMEIARNSLSAANTGLGSLPMLFDLAERGNNSELGVYSSLSSILGGPTVLSQSRARNYGEERSSSYAENWMRGNAWSFDTAVSGGV